MYQYDRNGNVLYKNNLVNTTFSELYHVSSTALGDNNVAYDKLNRLTAFSRGTLTSSGHNGTGLDTITTANLNSTTGVPNTNSWTLDALGNWTSSDLSGTQARTFNAKNQITGIGSLSTPTYDPNGNMLTDETGKHFVYDGWNRQVTVKATNNTTVLETFVYGAASHPIVENNGSGNDNWYYSAQGQVIEETYSTTYDQFVWGLGYVNELILRDRNADGASTGGLGKTGSGLEERIYSQYDANYNVTSLITQAASVKERFIYDSYGASVVLTPGWAVGTDGTNYWWYRYQGMRLDNTDALYMSQSRLYSPTLGRWVTVDPIGHADGMNGYEMEQSGPTSDVDPTGFYDEAGHYWTTFAIALMAGMSPADASNLAYWSQYPDMAGAGLDAIGSLLQDRLDQAERIQNYLHSLTNGDPEERRCILNKLLQNPELTPPEQGLLIHAYGDAYAHTWFDPFGNEHGFAPPFGHLFGGHAPDHIGNDPFKYRDYAQSLYTLLGGAPGNPLFQSFLESVPTQASSTIFDDAAISAAEPIWGQSWVQMLLPAGMNAPASVPGFQANRSLSTDDTNALMDMIQAAVSSGGCCDG
jgi:RHS repeat-associated protein